MTYAHTSTWPVGRIYRRIKLVYKIIFQRKRIGVIFWRLASQRVAETIGFAVAEATRCGRLLTRLEDGHASLWSIPGRFDRLLSSLCSLSSIRAC